MKMKNYKIRYEFDKFLIERNIKDEYFENLDLDYDSFFENILPPRYISSAFGWRDKKGNDYWLKIHNEWIDTILKRN